MDLPQKTSFLLASPDGEAGSLQLRQQVWVHQVTLAPGEQYQVKLHGPRAYLQSIHGSLDLQASSANQELLSCGDGAFLSEESQITLQAKTPLRALVIDLPA
jgi:redox-sensitive bicupin YhaK (pirin superfamily)